MIQNECETRWILCTAVAALIGGFAQAAEPKVAELPRQGMQAVASLRWSPDGRWFVTCERSGKRLIVWDAATRKQHATLGTGDLATLSSFSPDGRLLAVAEDPYVNPTSRPAVESPSLDERRDLAVRVWDLESGKLVARCGGERLAFSVQFTDDGRRLIVGAGSALTLWNTSDWKPAQTFNGDAALFKKRTLSRDGSRLLAAMGDGSLSLWDVTTRTRVAPLIDHPPEARQLPVEFLRELSLFTTPRQAEFSPDGQLIYELNQAKLRLWNRQGLEQGTLSACDDAAGAIGTQVEWAPRGTTFATSVALLDDPSKAGNEALLIELSRGESLDQTHAVVQLVTALDLQHPVRLPHSVPVHVLHFTADGKRLITAALDSTVRVWDATDGKLLGTWPVKKPIAGFEVAPDGKTLALWTGGHADRPNDAERRVLFVELDSLPTPQ
jgi:WD40 repeat protein